MFEFEGSPQMAKASNTSCPHTGLRDRTPLFENVEYVCSVEEANWDKQTNPPKWLFVLG